MLYHKFIDCYGKRKAPLVQDAGGCDTGQLVTHEGGIGAGHGSDLVQDGFADQIFAGLAQFGLQRIGVGTNHGRGDTSLVTFKIVLHLDGDADLCKFVHAAQLLLLSDGVLVGLTPGGEVDGVAGDFDLDLVHRGTVGEPGGGQDGGGDEREGEDDAADGVHFHGDFRLLSWEMGIKIAPGFLGRTRIESCLIL